MWVLRGVEFWEIFYPFLMSHICMGQSHSETGHTTWCIQVFFLFTFIFTTVLVSISLDSRCEQMMYFSPQFPNSSNTWKFCFKFLQKVKILMRSKTPKRSQKSLTMRQLSQPQKQTGMIQSQSQRSTQMKAVRVHLVMISWRLNLTTLLRGLILNEERFIT